MLNDPNLDQYDKDLRREELEELQGDLDTRVSQMYEVDCILFQADIPKYQIGKQKPLNESLGWNNLNRVIPLINCREPEDMKTHMKDYV